MPLRGGVGLIKKLVVAIFIASCVAFLIVGGKYAREWGALREYPDAEYLSDDEAEMRPAYSQLSKKEKAVYEALYRGIQAGEDRIPLPYEISGKTYSRIYCLLEKQESSLFYVDSTYYTAEKVREAQIVYREDDYSDKVDEFELMQKNAHKEIIGASGEYEHALKIHDYIIEKCTYVIGEDMKYSSTAYGCLVEGKANCEGYAKAFNLLASDAGLKCVLVTGTTDKGENHAWNQVCIDGEWYNVDVTWDDSDISGELRREYFLCNDEDFGKTHYPDNEFFESFACDAVENNYYVRNGLRAESFEEAEGIVIRQVSEGTDSVMVKFGSKSVYEEFKKRFLEERYIFNVLFEYGDAYNENFSITFKENEAELFVVLYFR